MADWLGGGQALELGPCNIYADTATGGQNLELGCFDQVILRMTVEKTDLVCAQYGTNAADKVVTAQMVEIEAGLGQATLERMEQFVQGFKLERNTANQIIGYSFSNAIGERDSDVAKQYTIKKIEAGIETTDNSKIIDLWKMAPEVSAELTFDSSTQRFVGLKLTAYRDENKLDSDGKATFFKSRVITP